MKTSYLAINFSLTGDNGLPDKLELIPAGEFSGLDGRSWSNTFPDTVIARTRAVGRDIPIDIEHATELKAPKGESAPAQGWIRLDDLEVLDGAIWGTVEWNNSGRALLGDKAYRYYSPAFLFDDQGEVRSIKSVGLTNTQNLSQLPALNHESTNQPQGGADDMSLPAAIRQALGLREDANEADAVQAIGTLKTEHQVALNRAENPDLQKFVPAETHELALNRADTAEKALTEYRTREMEAEVDAAIEARKIAPANKEQYLAMCRQEGGLENFREIVRKSPEIISNDGGKGGKKPEADQEQSKLTADELAICRDLGISETEYLAAKA